MSLKKEIIDIIRNKKTQIPTLPQVVDKILDTARDERSSAKDLADIISRDQAISNKILRLVNSAYYGMMKEVDTISRAIAIIGFNEVISLVIGMSVFSAFDKDKAQDVLDMSAFWLHAIGCAEAAKGIADICQPDIANQIFLPALLHDAGKIIFMIYFPGQYSMVLSEASKEMVPLYRKEKEGLGLDHASLAGLLMERWNFPESILLPSRFHHRSEECPIAFRNHAMVIELADQLCHEVEIGRSGNPVKPTPKALGRKLGLSIKEREKVAEELEGKREKISAFLSLFG